MDEVLPEFTMEELTTMSKRVLREYNSPWMDQAGHMTIAITDAFCIVDETLVTESGTPPWTHYDNQSSVEMNFLLERQVLQTHEGLLDRYRYRKGHQNILSNRYTEETNQFLGRGAHHMSSIYASPEKIMELLAGYLEEMAPFAEKLVKGKPLVLQAPGQRLTNELALRPGAY